MKSIQSICSFKAAESFLNASYFKSIEFHVKKFKTSETIIFLLCTFTYAAFTAFKSIPIAQFIDISSVNQK